MKNYFRVFYDLAIDEAVGTIKKTVLDFKTELQTKFDAEMVAIRQRDADLQKLFDAQKTSMIALGATIGEISEAQKDFNTRMGRFQSMFPDGMPGGRRVDKYNQPGETLYKYLLENQDYYKAIAEGNKFDKSKINLKASAVTTSSISAPYITFLPWQPGMEPIGQFRIRSLVNTIPSDFDTVDFPQANTPVGAGSFSNQTEGNNKDQVDRGYTMQTLNLKTMSGFIIVTRQSLRNIPFMSTWLPTSLNEQLLDSEDLAFANSLVAGATGSTAGVTIGTTVNIEAITILIKNLMKKKFYPTAIALDPDVWQKILVTKAVTSGQYSLPVGSVAIDPQGNVTVLGRPLYPVNWLTGGRCLIADWTKASIVESQSLTFLQSDSHASTFIQNELTFLLERTEGIAQFRPDAFVTCLLTAAT